MQFLKATQQLLKYPKLFLKKNATQILSTVAVLGLVTTAVSAVRATPRAIYLLSAEEDRKHRKLTATEAILAVGPVYIPSALIGTATIMCIISAQSINQRRQRSMSSAYLLLSSTYRDYRNKTKELFGEDADQKIRTAIARDHYQNTPVQSDKCLFYDQISERYFEKTMIEVQDAEYQLNRKFSMDGYASLNDFYDLLGIDHTLEGDTLGWAMDSSYDFYGICWIDFEHELVTLDDGLECYILTLPLLPNCDYLDWVPIDKDLAEATDYFKKR